MLVSLDNMFAEICTFAFVLNVVDLKLEPKVVKGHLGDIISYAHSAYLHVNCRDGGYVCGASVINQKILLTAAHCIENCVDNNQCTDAVAYTGHVHKRLGEKHKLAGFLMHEKYNRRGVHNDIGLILLQKPLNLGKLTKRIAILRSPPWKNSAVVAGWGLINEEQTEYTDYLHYTELKVWTFEECRRIISTLPRGCLCAGKFDGYAYASEGDSGSALIINKYVQIGLVSYKRPDISRSIVAFTNISYYYDWIKRNAKRLYCSVKK